MVKPSAPPGRSGAQLRLGFLGQKTRNWLQLKITTTTTTKSLSSVSVGARLLDPARRLASRPLQGAAQPGTARLGPEPLPGSARVRGWCSCARTSPHTFVMSTGSLQLHVETQAHGPASIPPHPCFAQIFAVGRKNHLVLQSRS